MIQGEIKDTVKRDNSKFVGFTKVEVAAINPTKSEINKLLGKEDSDNDKEIEYLSEDNEGNKKLRMSFWLRSEKLDRFFVYSFNLIDKVRMNKAGDKHQYVNSVCDSSWADSPENLPDFFTSFIEEGESVGEKKVKEAIMGEADLCSLVRVWLGRLNWKNPKTEVMIDTKTLFKENYKELRSQIDGNYCTPFVALLGVRTDESDPNKNYQQVYGKFLQEGFMESIEKNDFSNSYISKNFNKFMNEASGQYGFDCYFEQTAAVPYDSERDIAAAELTKAETAPTSAKY